MPAQATRWRSRRTWAAPIPLTERSRISLPNTPIRPSVTTRGSPTPCAPDSSPRDAMTGRIASQSRRHSDQVLAPPLARPAVHPGARLSSTSPCVPNLSDSDAASTIPTSATARYRQHTPRSRPLRPTGLAHQMCPGPLLDDTRTLASGPVASEFRPSLQTLAVDEHRAPRATRRGAVARVAEATVSRSLGPYARSSSPSGSEPGVRIGEWRRYSRPSSDIPGTTRGLGVTTRKDACRSCSAARRRHSRGSSCVVPARRRGGARRPPWRACSRRAAARWRQTRASSAGRSRSLGGTRRYRSCTGLRAFPCRHAMRQGAAPPVRINGEARCSDPCDWPPRVQ